MNNYSNDNDVLRVQKFIGVKHWDLAEALEYWVSLVRRFQKDPSWSDTGDRYLLKLFRDHLFHQVTEAATPWIDLSHIVCCLNKVKPPIG